MNKREYPTSQENGTFLHQEKVQFNDGEIALGFHEKGDNLVLGPGSTHKYARSFDTIDMAWVTTKSGNHYGIAGGYVINQDRQLAWELPIDDLQVTIGETLQIPGVGITSDVESVLLRWKVDSPGSSDADQHIDTPSPFILLGKQVANIVSSIQDQA